MSAPSLDPVEGVLAVLDDGAATGTNKFGLLLALIDLAPSVAADRVLPVAAIAERLLELHWDHARSYRGTVLRQVTSRNRDNTTVVLEVQRLHRSLPEDLSFERARPLLDPQRWRSSVDTVARATDKNPLRLLQRLRGDPAPFLYDILPGTPRRIRFVDGALEALVRFGPVLRDLVEFRFVRFVAAANRAALGTPVEDELDEHLFGADRHMPPAALRHDLWELQGGRCVYTDQPVPDPGRPRSRTAVDHVLPWARVRVSALQNLVVTDGATNSSKQHLLLAPGPLGRWVDHLVVHADAIAAVAAAHGWPADLTHVAAVAHALYQRTTPATPTWSPGDRVRALGPDGRRRAVHLLTALVDDR